MRDKVSHYNADPSGIECHEFFPYLNAYRALQLKHAWRLGLKRTDGQTEIEATIADLIKVRAYALMEAQCTTSLQAAPIDGNYRSLLDHWMRFNKTSKHTALVLAVADDARPSLVISECEMWISELGGTLP